MWLHRWKYIEKSVMAGKDVGKTNWYFLTKEGKELATKIKMGLVLRLKEDPESNAPKVLISYKTPAKLKQQDENMKAGRAKAKESNGD
jgi:hypothetical protein